MIGSLPELELTASGLPVCFKICYAFLYSAPFITFLMRLPGAKQYSVLFDACGGYITIIQWYTFIFSFSKQGM
jgi:hypothetical protein